MFRKAKPHLVDDRGKSFRLMSGRQLGDCAADASRTGRADVAAALLHANRILQDVPSLHERVNGRMLIRLLLPVILVFGMLLVVQTLQLPQWTMHVWIVIVFFGAMWALAYTPTVEMIEDYKAALAARDLCRGCGYDMQALAADADGCAACPECGAAWRLRLSPDDLEKLERVRTHHAVPRDKDNVSYGGGVVDALGVAQPCVSLATLHDAAISESARMKSFSSRAWRGLGVLPVIVFSAYLVWWGLPVATQPAWTTTYVLSVIGVLIGLGGAVSIVQIIRMSWRVDSAFHARAIAMAAIEHGRCPACTAPLGQTETSTLRRPCTQCAAVWSTVREPGKLF